jgi:hypothetical protein
VTAEYEPTAEQAWLMTKLLEQAVEAARALPPEMQEAYVTAAAFQPPQCELFAGLRLHHLLSAGFKLIWRYRDAVVLTANLFRNFCG